MMKCRWCCGGVNEKIIARGHNMMERLNDPTAHAEMIALTSAFNSAWQQIFSGSNFVCNRGTLFYVCRCYLLE